MGKMVGQFGLSSLGRAKGLLEGKTLSIVDWTIGVKWMHYSSFTNA